MPICFLRRRLAVFLRFPSPSELFNFRQWPNGVNLQQTAVFCDLCFRLGLFPRTVSECCSACAFRVGFSTTQATELYSDNLHNCTQNPSGRYFDKDRCFWTTVFFSPAENSWALTKNGENDDFTQKQGALLLRPRKPTKVTNTTHAKPPFLPPREEARLKKRSLS